MPVLSSCYVISVFFFLILRHFIFFPLLSHFHFCPPPTSLLYHSYNYTYNFNISVSYLHLLHFRIISTNTSFPFSFLYLHHFNHFNKISSISFLHLRHFRIMSTAAHSVGYLSSSKVIAVFSYNYHTSLPFSSAPRSLPVSFL